MKEWQWQLGENGVSARWVQNGHTVLVLVQPIEQPTKNPESLIFNTSHAVSELRERIRRDYE